MRRRYSINITAWSPRKLSFKCIPSAGVGGGVQGVLPHSQNFRFGENPVKILQNPRKTCGNLGKMYENHRKIAVCALILQKWHPKWKCRRFFFGDCVCFCSFFGHVRNLGKNAVWSALISKNAPSMKWNVDVFWRSFCLEFFSGKFGEI